ncbi:MAG: hypothetical protein JWP27_2928 [Flaviaesturariibacter sp.]|nr:hypothetical protein [Flaviaesturariibacter sp.]
MTVVFGWRTFLVRSYSFAELGLPDLATGPCTIEVRQKYAHLFWIPFFGIGKKWALRRGKDLYELPLEIEAHLERTRVRTPWYTYSGPLLLLLAGIVFWASQAYDEHQSAVYAETSFNEQAATLKKDLHDLSKKDFIKVQDPAHPYEDNSHYFKVDSVDAVNVYVRPFSTGKSEYSMTPLEVEQFYEAKKDDYPVIAVPRARLEGAFAPDYAAYRQPVHKGVDLLGTGLSYEIVRVEHHYAPLITRSGGGMGGNLYLNFENKGWPVILVGLKSGAGSLEWSSDLPTSFENRSPYAFRNFTIGARNYKTNLEYSVIFTVQDSLGQRYDYLVQGVNMQQQVRMVGSRE